MAKKSNVSSQSNGTTVSKIEATPAAQSVVAANRSVAAPMPAAPVALPAPVAPVAQAPVASPAQESNRRKTECPITLQEFRDGAKDVKVTLNGESVSAEVKEFSTGSLGWFFGGKVTVEINGVKVKVQVGLNMTIIGSKELPKS